MSVPRPPRRNAPKIVVTGYIGLLPAGGAAWDYIQYVLGFRELGCEVLYLEDTQQWPVYQHYEGDVSCKPNVEYLDALMQRFDLQDRWVYRDVVTDQHFGLSASDTRRFCASADLLINLSCSTPLREEYSAIPARALIDTDPMFTQVQVVTGKTLKGEWSALPDMIAGHTHFFTFGENAGRSGCEVPSLGLHWIPTRQPVALSYWPATPLAEATPYTTVLNWTVAKDFEFQGRTWGQKNVEFMRFLEIPRLASDVSFSVAVGQTMGDPFPTETAKRNGWQVLDPQCVAGDAHTYQSFIQASRGEFSVAKHTYVQAKTGWFSGRSACYLSSGRPVVTQDTGWSEILPTGCGLFAFEDQETALDAIRRIEREPEMHSRSARCVAEDAFDSRKVLGKLLDDVGL